MDAVKILQIVDDVKAGNISLAEGSLKLIQMGLKSDEIIKLLE